MKSLLLYASTPLSGTVIFKTERSERTQRNFYVKNHYLVTMHITWYVYILRCSDDSYYTGMTNDPDRRLIEHNMGIVPGAYTYSRRPVEMVWLYQCFDPTHAIELEKQVKGWTRKKKEALIRGEWDELKLLAVCKNVTSHKNRND